MPKISAPLLVHDDTYHTGSAKRDDYGGVAALDIDGSVVGKGCHLYLVRDSSNNIYIKERISGNLAIYIKRIGTTDFIMAVREAGVWKQVLTESMKNAPSGILALDSSQFCKFKRDYISRNRYVDNLGTDVYHANDTQKSTTNTSPTKIKEIQLNTTPDSSLKIYFELANNDNVTTVYAQIYRNEVAVGTQRSNNTWTYIGFTETVSGWDDGDLLQVYAWTTGAGGSYVRNLRILCTLATGVAELINTM